MEEFDIILTICPPWGKPSIPIGLAYLSKYLKNKGLKPKTLDLNLEVFNNSSNEEFKKYWLPKYYNYWTEQGLFCKFVKNLSNQINYCVSRLLSFSTKIVGFSINQSNRNFSVIVAQELKRRNRKIKIIFGGLGVFIKGERILIPRGIIDAYVMGEGEETLFEVITRAKEGDSLLGVPGILLERFEANYISRKMIENLDQIPFPTYEEFSIDAYPQSDTIHIISSRGCMNRCVFCGDWPFWGRFRKRSGKNTFDEIKYHYEKYKITAVEFNDLACNWNVEELRELCNLLINSKIQIRWQSYAVLNNRMTDNILRNMKLAGCFSLSFGLESGSNKILKSMNKNYTAEVAEEVIRRTHNAGIQTRINIIVGFPGEGEEELQETIDFLIRNAEYIAAIEAISVCYIKPLSMLERRPQDYNIILSDRNDRWYNWSALDGSSNYAKRKGSADKILEVVKNLRSNFDKDNLYGYF